MNEFANAWSWGTVLSLIITVCLWFLLSIVVGPFKNPIQALCGIFIGILGLTTIALVINWIRKKTNLYNSREIFISSGCFFNLLLLSLHFFHLTQRNLLMKNLLMNENFIRNFHYYLSLIAKKYPLQMKTMTGVYAYHVDLTMDCESEK